MPADCTTLVRCALALSCLLAANAASAQSVVDVRVLPGDAAARSGAHDTWPAQDSPAQAKLPPPVFDKRPYGDAKKAAAAGQRWLIVDATAEWCAPCQEMLKTTWRDEQVVAWLTAHAIAVEIDFDAEGKLATELRIESLPTVIAFREGDQEFDRVVGYKTPSEILKWMEGITKGERAVDALRARAEGHGPSEKIDIQARLDLARGLKESGRDGEAADQYAWLWRYSLEHDAFFAGVRLSFMKADMQELAAQSESAKKTFTVLRDESETALRKEEPTLMGVMDWIALNEIAGDKKRILTWFDRVKDDASWSAILEMVSTSPDFEDLLVEQARWADLGKLYKDPVQVLDWAETMRRVMSMDPALPDDLEEEERAFLTEMPQSTFRNKAGRLYAALLAAGREKEAQAVVERARKLDDSPRMIAALVSTALEAGQVRREHLDWVAVAQKTDPSLSGLSRRIQEALSAKNKK